MDSFTGATSAWRTGRRQYLSPDRKEKRWYPKDQQPSGWVWVQVKQKRIKLKDYTDLEWKQHIYERCLIHPTTGCWIWQKAILKSSPANPSGGGYGMMSFYEDDSPKMRLVHRVAFQLWVGPIPEGRDVLHHGGVCTSKACCNPDHLYAGTPRQNIQDAIGSGLIFGGRVTKGTLSYTDGTVHKRCIPGTQPKGFEPSKGVLKYTYTNSERTERGRFPKDQQPDGWVRAYNGRGGTTDSKWYTNGLDNSMWFPGLPIPSAEEGWRPGQTANHYKNKGKQ